jgi:hypothetical protein
MMRKYIAGVVVVALAFGGVSLATADESVQTEVGLVKPRKLSNSKHQKVKFTNIITTFNQASTGQPPSATRTILDLPKQFKINTKAVNKCRTDAAGLQAAAVTKEAIRACGKRSLVTDPRGSSAQVTVAGSPPLVIDVEVSGFNENGKKLLLYSKPVGAASGIPASILVGKLKKSSKVAGRPPGTASGGFKQSLDVAIPPLAAGAISLFEVTLFKSSGYVKAKCKPRRMKFQATTFFSNASPAADGFSFGCKPKGR